MSPDLNFQVIPMAEVPFHGSAAKDRHAKPLVLVGDDGRVIADTLSIILSKNGLSVLTAYDGESALELTTAAPPDLLLRT